MSAKGLWKLQSMGISAFEVSEGHWRGSSLQGRQQPVVPVDSQDIEGSSSTKMQVEDVLDYWKMKADGGKGLHTVIWETFLNVLKRANAYSVSTDYRLSTLPPNSQEEGCQFNSNFCKMLIRTRIIPIRECTLAWGCLWHPQQDLYILAWCFGIQHQRGLVIWQGYLHHYAVRFPEEFSQCSVRGRVRTSGTKAKTKHYTSFACLFSLRPRGVQSGRRVEGSTVQNSRLIKRTHINKGLQHQYKMG